MIYHETKLKNGLTLITIPLASTKTITVLVVVSTGSKYETKDENGISHFLEHMFFKGTEKRPSTLTISQELDSIGAEYNAFTSKELTGYWVKAAAKHLLLLLDVISDMFLNSKLDPQEIEREKAVITEEMNLYKDTPTRYVEDLFEGLLYKNQPAGKLIIGTKENIKNFTKEKILNYFKTQYQAKDTIVFIAGDAKKLLDRGKIKRVTEEYFENIGRGEKNDKVRVKEIQRKPETVLHFKETDQSHIIIGARAYSALSPKIYPLTLLSTILGGNMSSRLFIEVRERRGLAYYIRSSIQSYTDSGYIAIQAGVPNDKLLLSIKVILEELKKIKEKKVESRELQKSKDYIKGRLMLDLESSDEFAFFMAEQKVIRGDILTPDEISKKIDRVTQDDVQKIANEVFKNTKLNLAIIGPHKQKNRFASILGV